MDMNHQITQLKRKPQTQNISPSLQTPTPKQLFRQNHLKFEHVNLMWQLGTNMPDMDSIWVPAAEDMRVRDRGGSRIPVESTWSHALRFPLRRGRRRPRLVGVAVRVHLGDSGLDAEQDQAEGRKISEQQELHG